MSFTFQNLMDNLVLMILVVMKAEILQQFGVFSKRI